MPTTINNVQTFSLLEVARSIEKTLEGRYSSAYWVRAEMNKLNYYSHSGHCYPELLEKNGNQVVAQMKAILWKGNYEQINRRFLQVLKEPLKDGIKIMFLARVTFSPAYGLSLIIEDIDPSYTLGDLEKEKQETINRMKREGVYHLNKEKPLPLLPKRIAIISVETSKGYADFINVLSGNAWNYAFFHMLFPSLLQGDKAAASVIRQLERIKRVIHHFDAVAIIRGGGGDVGLSCFNDYNLAEAVATFPIPVLTGIGHATNETVVEMISFSNQITPTKTAEFLIQQYHNFSRPVDEAQQSLVNKSVQLLIDHKLLLQNQVRFFRSATETILNGNHQFISSQFKSMQQSVGYYLQRSHQDLRRSFEDISWSSNILLNKERTDVQRFVELIKKDANHLIQRHQTNLTHLNKNIENLDPKRVLQRGFSISRLNGKAVKDIDQLKIGDVLETELAEGTAIGIIKTLNPPIKNG